MTPLEAFLKEKSAAEKSASFSSGFRKQIRPTSFGSALGQGAATALVSAGMAGIGMATAKIYDAMTKKRDFNQMLESNPDLIEHHEQDPKRFNQMFSSLRMMNPAFSADPVVAGTYMRRMAESPLSSGGIAVEALGHRETTKSPIMDAFVRGGLEGAKKGVNPEPKKPHTP